MPIKERWGYSFQEENHSGECPSRNLMGREYLESVWGVNCRKWPSIAFHAERSCCKVQSWYWVIGLVLCCLLHLVLAKETRIGWGVLRSRSLSALKELVWRNGLPTLLSSSFKNRFHYLLIYVLKFISVCEQIMNDYMLCCKLLSLKSLSSFKVEFVLWWKINPTCVFPHLE